MLLIVSAQKFVMVVGLAYQPLWLSVYQTSISLLVGSLHRPLHSSDNSDKLAWSRHTSSFFADR